MNFPCHMMATAAIHQFGDISRPEPDLCLIERQEGDDYIGAWVTGFGFFNVRFPVATTRRLTAEEIERYSACHIRINNQPSHNLVIEGYDNGPSARGADDE